MPVFGWSQTCTDSVETVQYATKAFQYTAQRPYTFTSITTKNNGSLVETYIPNGLQLMCLAADGAVLWNNQVSLPNIYNAGQIQELGNGNIALLNTVKVGGQSPYAATAITMLTAGGGVLWQKIFRNFVDAFSSLAPNNLTELSGNNLLFTAQSNFSNDVIAIKLNSSGDTIWAHNYGIEHQFNNGGANLIGFKTATVQYNNNIYLTGLCSVTGTITENVCWVLKLDTAGNLLNANTWLLSRNGPLTAGFDFSDKPLFLQATGGRLILGVSNGPTYIQNQPYTGTGLLLQVDTALALINGFEVYPNFTTTGNATFFTAYNNMYAFCVAGTQTALYAFVDANAHIGTQRSIVYTAPANNVLFNARANNVVNIVAATPQADSIHLFVTGANPEYLSGTGCTGKDTAFAAIQNLNFTSITNGSVLYTSFNGLDSIFSVDVPGTPTGYAQKQQITCRQKSICDTLHIKGSNTHCGYSTLQFVAQTGLYCQKKITWQTNLPGSVLQMINDSTEQLVITDGRAKGYIFASIPGCGLADSTYISTQFKPASLGFKDTLLCAGTSLLLDPGKNFVYCQWQDTLVTHTFTVTSPGKYFVSATDSCGIPSSDTVTIRYKPLQPRVNLGNDTTICRTTPFILQPYYNYTSYLWQDGSTANNYPIINEGKYYVTVTDSCGNISSDTINITFIKLAPPYIGSDTTLCHGSTDTLRTALHYAGYRWPDGSHKPFFVVTQPGDYYVLVGDGSCNLAYSDTIHITYRQLLPPVNLGNDTTICSANTFTLQSGAGYKTYIWQDGSIASTYTVTQPGKYYVTVSDSCGNISSDTINVRFADVPHAVSLGNDTTLCPNATYTLHAGQYKSYTWQDGSAASFFTIRHAGTYSVTVSDSCGNVSSDTIVVSYAPQIPIDSALITLCYGKGINITLPPGYTNYTWRPAYGIDSPFARTVYATPLTTTVYTVTATAPPACTVTGNITITVNNCIDTLYMPTAFTPNGDGRNDVIYPVISAQTSYYEFFVYNRVGQLVFHSKKQGQGWDGTFNGQLQSTGAYVWLCRYALAGKPLQMGKGYFVLIK